MTGTSTLIGRLVQALVARADGKARLETCLIVDDRPEEVILVPLAIAVAVAAAHEDFDVAPAILAADPSALAQHPAAFGASKIMRPDALRFRAAGSEFRFFGECH